MIEARVVLGSSGGATVGRERIRLLAAVAREGSISAGARSVGLTYKAAWDAIDVMSTLAGTRLLATQAGGLAGGGANLTSAGAALIAGYLHLEAELARAVEVIKPDLAGAGLSSLDLSDGAFLRTSARNALSGTITALRSSEITVEVLVALRGDATVRATVTRVSVHELGLTVGRSVMVLIKASLVMIRAAHATSHPDRNCLRGTVRRCVQGATQAEIVLDLGQDRTIAATLTAETARKLDLTPGGEAWALFDPAHVILAIN